MSASKKAAPKDGRERKDLMNDLKLFESQYIRSVWNDEEGQWYFSVVDVIGALAESTDPSAYWRKLKQRLKKEGNETVTNCHRLKLPAADGKMRLTDVANTEQLLRKDGRRCPTGSQKIHTKISGSSLARLLPNGAR